MHTCRTHSTAAILANAIVTEPINTKNSTKSAYRLAPCKNSGKSELLNFVKSRLTCASTYTCLSVAEKENVWPISLVRECAVKNRHFLPLLFPFGNGTVQKLENRQFFGLFWYKTRDFLFVSGSSFELKSKAIIWEKLKIEPRKTLHFVTTVTQFYRQHCLFIYVFVDLCSQWSSHPISKAKCGWWISWNSRQIWWSSK